MVPLARAFLERGDEVLWATGEEVCGRLEREGIRTSVAGLDDGVAMSTFYEQFSEVQTFRRRSGRTSCFPDCSGACAPPAMLADLMPVARTWSPELVVCDAAEFAGPIAAAAGWRAERHARVWGPAPRAAGRGHRRGGRSRCGPRTASSPDRTAGSYDNLYLDIYPSSMQPADRPHIPAIAAAPARRVRDRRRGAPARLGHGTVGGSPRVRHARHGVQQRRSALHQLSTRSATCRCVSW